MRQAERKMTQDMAHKIQNLLKEELKKGKATNRDEILIIDQKGFNSVINKNSK